MTPCQSREQLQRAWDIATLHRSQYTSEAIIATKLCLDRHLKECPVCNPEGTRKRVTDLRLRPSRRHRNEFIGK
jgi:hypothetical protein